MLVRHVLREPLLHFLLIGLGLFFLYGRASPGDSESRRITVRQSQVDSLAAQYQAVWNRQPSAAEFNKLIDTYVRDEIFYREGLSMGLDRDDALIKRRVRQKHDLIAEESSGDAPATEADLAAWLATHPARYAQPAVVTFQQVMVDPAKHGRSTAATLGAIRSELADGADPATLGDSHMLPARVDSLPVDFVARDFGPRFAVALSRLKVGSWEGPLRSGFGLHLVRVEQRVPGRVPKLHEVRAEVARDWEADRRAKAAAAYYRALRKGYDVVISASLPSAPKP